MRFKANTICFALIVCMTLGAFAPSGVSGAGGGVSADARYVELLAALGIFDGGAAGREAQTVTRAKAAEYMAHILGFKSLDPTGTDFADVTAAHSLSGYIGVLERLNIIGGIVFNPDDDLMYNEAVKMLVGTLGFGILAEAKGGYPVGYFSVAQDLRLLRGVKFSGGGKVTYDGLARMIYNSFDVETNLAAHGTHVSYVKTGGFILNTLGISRIKGFYLADDVTSLGGGNACASGSIRVDDTVLDVSGYSGKSALRGKLGYKLEVFYSGDEGENRVVYVNFTADGANTITIHADDIDKYEVAANAVSLRYYDVQSNSLQYADIDVRSKMIYNDVLEAPDLKRYLDALTASGLGCVSLTDGDGNGIYEIVSFYEYVNYSVAARSSEGVLLCEVYEDGSWQRVNFDLSGSVYRKAIIILDGIEVSLSSIRQDCIVSISVSNDGTVIRLNGSSNTKSVTIDEVTSEGVSSGGAEYRYGGGYSENPTPGAGAVIYLDAFGKISRMKMTSAIASSIGLLLNVAPPNGLGNYQFHILDKSGRHLILESALKIKVNGKSGGTIIAADGVNGLAPLYRDNGQVSTASNNAVKHTFKSTALWYKSFRPYEIQQGTLVEGEEFDLSGNPRYNPTGIIQPWMSPEERIIALNRRPVYFKTDGNGKLSEICASDVYAAGGSILEFYSPANGGVLYEHSFKTQIFNEPIFKNQKNNVFLTLESQPEYVLPSAQMSVFVVQNAFFDNNASYVDDRGLAKFLDFTSLRMSMYATDEETGLVDIAFVYSDVQNVNYVVVESVARGIDEDGEKIVIKGWSNGQARKFMIDPDIKMTDLYIPKNAQGVPAAYDEILPLFSANPQRITDVPQVLYPYSLSSIRPGDIVTIMVNRNTGKVLSLNLVFSQEKRFIFQNEDVLNAQTRQIYTQEHRYLYGKIGDIRGNYLIVDDIVKRMGSGSVNNTILNIFTNPFNLNQAQRFYSYSAARGTVTQLSGIDKSYIGKYVYLKVLNSGIMDLVVYED